MDLTLLIAIIGCITGFTSLIIQLSSYLSTVARLKIETDDSSNSYFFKAKDFKVDTYKTNFSAVVSLVISNKSSYPVTISNIYLKNRKKKYQLRHNNKFKFSPKEIPLGEGSFTYYNPSVAIDLPYRIEPYDTVYASVRLPFFDELVDHNDLSKSVKFKLIINTPRKAFTHKVKLYDYMYYHDHLQEIRNK